MSVYCSSTTHKLKAALAEKISSDYNCVVLTAKRKLPELRTQVSGELYQSYLDVWETALLDKDTLLNLVLDETAHGLTMWQIAPFAGVFSPKERWAILRSDKNE